MSGSEVAQWFARGSAQVVLDAARDAGFREMDEQGHALTFNRQGRDLDELVAVLNGCGVEMESLDSLLARARPWLVEALTDIRERVQPGLGRPPMVVPHDVVAMIVLIAMGATEQQAKDWGQFMPDYAFAIGQLGRDPRFR